MALNTAVPLYFELIMESVYGWGDEGSGVRPSVQLCVEVCALKQTWRWLLLDVTAG